MRPKIALIHNQPETDKYAAAGEAKAIVGVFEAVSAVSDALTALSYPVTLVPLLPPLDLALDKLRDLDCKVVFNLFEGFEGRPETEAEVARALADLGFAFTGCPCGALSLALHKGRSKDILADAAIRTPRHQVLTPETASRFRLSYPCIVKPCQEDASHGLSEESVVRDSASLKKQVERMCTTYGGTALVEEFVGGREFNVTVMGNEELDVLPVSEIEYSLPDSMPRILTFEAKWEPDSVYFQHTRAVCPGNVSPELERNIREIACQSFKLLGCKGYARVDLRLDHESRLMVLEVNPNPDISPGTGAARQAMASGMTYNEFVEKIVKLALE